MSRFELGGFLVIRFSIISCRYISLVVTVVATSMGFSTSFMTFTSLICIFAILMLNFTILLNKDRTQYHLKAFFINFFIFFIYMLIVCFIFIQMGCFSDRLMIFLIDMMMISTDD